MFPKLGHPSPQERGCISFFSTHDNILVQGQTLLYVGVKARAVASDVNIFVAKELRILFMWFVNVWQHIEAISFNDPNFFKQT